MAGPQQNVGTSKQSENKQVGRRANKAKDLIETPEAVETRQQQMEAAERIAAAHPSGTTDAALPERDKRGQLTRSAMEKILDGGGSVLMHRRNSNGDIVDGRMIANHDDLPSEAELSEGDSDAEEAALRALETRQTQLDADRMKILSRRGRGMPNEPLQQRNTAGIQQQTGMQQQQQRQAPPIPPQQRPPQQPAQTTPATGARPGSPAASVTLPGVPQVPTEGE